MKKSLFVFMLVISLIFSFSSLSLANESANVAQVLSEFEGEWSPLLRATYYVLAINPIEEKEDRFEIILSVKSPALNQDVLTGEVELDTTEEGIFSYVFGPSDEAKYTGGIIQLNNKGVSIFYVDKDNNPIRLNFVQKVEMKE